ncbi:MAG TPA: outer membrane beta-barrel protein [Bryobacteraceae bacterium]|nr:outer membrane beta-barrel protein [Bryobacteraceae bacterium]
MVLALCAAASAHPGQTSQPAAGGAPQSMADTYPDIIELDPFGGVSIFGQIHSGLGEKLVTGGDVGGRAAWNFSRHLGLELSYSFLVNNVRLVTPIAPGLPSYGFGEQIHYPALNAVYNIKSRGSRFQPYVTVGVGAAQFTPTGRAEAYAREPAVNAIYNSAGLNDNLQVAMNYGGGVKFHLSEHLGFRFDVRGMWSRNPTFGLPNAPMGGIYIPSKKSLNGVQVTVGLVWFLKKPYAPPPPAPPAPPAPLNVGEITGSGTLLCQGKAVALHSTASDPAGHALTYTWKLNGNPQGSNSPDFSFTPNNAGDFRIEVTITDSTNPARTVTAGPLTLTVKEYAKPEISTVAASPTTLSCAAEANGTHTANLSATATGSACGGNLTYKWTVSEGSVANDTSANATFDSSSLNFEGAAGQTKTVTATLTVTDETQQTASQSSTITVNCPPQFKRLADVIFGKGKARVNNCGKRILIDQAASQAGTTYDVVLVGHRTADESRPAGRRRRRAAEARSLDEQRALNAAAVLTGGSGTCGNFDPAQVKIDWVGTDSTSSPDPGLCGTSNRPPTTKERRGSQVSEADKDRRVEVYLVPRNSHAMPPAVKNPRQLPEAAMKAVGCPR